ncbi:MAG: ParB N-terminal domain-containing protein [Microbacterium sp.]|uniref:ParB/RepB/Spo0J family partition protein n=1 Tax=Microbacterium sp. TaxID=51671 RepID=UPI00261DC866|nr:ParB/RepB/Spo0J family partition protein [Microbacterium sp.]MCV0420089.1 ParB N-terminal domain-containing protein [Microbacterium sp.]
MKTFKEMRRTGEVKRGEANSVRLGNIHEEPGFNLRDYEDPEFAQGIEELAEYIAGGGQIPPIEVRPREDGGVWLVDGHRRTRALNKLFDDGRLPTDASGDCWVRVEPFVGNDVQRTLRIMSSQEGQKLSALQIARGYERLRALNLSVSEIAAARHKSTSHVEQHLLLLNSGNGDVHQMVSAGVISPSLATEVVREHGENAGQVIAEAAAKSGGKKVTAKSIKGPSVPRKLLDEIQAAADRLYSSIPDSDISDMAVLGSFEVDSSLLNDLCVLVRQAREALK